MCQIDFAINMVVPLLEVLRISDSAKVLAIEHGGSTSLDYNMKLSVVYETT